MYAETTLENLFNCKVCGPEKLKAFKEIYKNYAETAVLEAKDILDPFFEKTEKSIYRLGSGYNLFQVSVVF